MADLGLPTQFTGRGKAVRANKKCPDKHEHKMPDSPTVPICVASSTGVVKKRTSS